MLSMIQFLQEDVLCFQSPVRQGQAVPCPPAWTSSPRPSGSPAHTSPRKKNQGDVQVDMYIYTYIW